MISYNTAIVLAGASLLGATSGLIGAFAVLRRRALLGDALAHAALPGLCIAFLVVGSRHLPSMLLGALISGLVGTVVVTLLRRYTRVKEDAAIGIVLSVFFGLGIVISRWIQNLSTTGSKAGLDHYIYGKTAGMIAQDVLLIALVSGVCLIAIVCLFKEFKLVVFDPGFARSQGWPVTALDLGIMALIAVTVVIGLPAVGVVLMAALLILPAVAARFWTDHLHRMLAISACIGLATGLVGTAASAYFDDLPAGPVIVLVGAGFFILSMLVGPRRGIVAQWTEHTRFKRSLADRNLLCAAYALVDGDDATAAQFSADEIARVRRWTTREARKRIGAAVRAGYLERSGDEHYRFTSAGRRRAAELAHDQKLWETYLATYPEEAAGAGNFGREFARDVLPREVIEELEALLEGDAADAKTAEGGNA